MQDDTAVKKICDAVRRLDPGADVVADLNTKRIMIGSSAEAGDVAEAIAATGLTVKAAT